RISPSSTVFSLLSTIQSLIWDRKDPFFIGHIRAHTGLPGALSLGNDLADKTTHDIHIFSTLEEAINFHKRFYVNANTLQKHFKITKEKAREIIKQCQNCV
ncbi:hypothetical protein H1C71_001413, partial [Ictidomys tridecemlineatus]